MQLMLDILIERANIILTPLILICAVALKERLRISGLKAGLLSLLWVTSIYCLAVISLFLLLKT